MSSVIELSTIAAAETDAASMLAAETVDCVASVPRPRTDLADAAVAVAARSCPVAPTARNETVDVLVMLTRPVEPAETAWPIACRLT